MMTFVSHASGMTAEVHGKDIKTNNSLARQMRAITYEPGISFLWRQNLFHSPKVESNVFITLAFSSKEQKAVVIFVINEGRVIYYVYERSLPVHSVLAILTSPTYITASCCAK